MWGFVYFSVCVCACSCTVCVSVPLCVCMKQVTNQPPPHSHPLAVSDKGSAQKEEVACLVEVNLQHHRSS